MPTDPAAGGTEHVDRQPGSQPATTPSSSDPEDPTAMNTAIRPFTVVDAAIRLAIVGLTLGTAYIHSTLGGLLFTLNATGYLVAAVAMIVPLALASRFRWVIRAGLMGYAATTILGWAIQGPYFELAYIAKAIEVALIGLVAVDFVRFDGNPVSVVRREIATAREFVAARRTGLAGA